MTAVLLFVLAGWVLLGIAGTIFGINKPRKPLTPGGAAGIVFFSLGMAALLIVAAIQLIGASA